MPSDIQVTLYFKKFADEEPKVNTALLLYTSQYKDFDYGSMVEGGVVIFDSRSVSLSSPYAPDYWAYLPEELLTI